MKYIKNLASNYPARENPIELDVVIEGGAFNGLYITGCMLLLKELERKKSQDLEYLNNFINNNIMTDKILLYKNNNTYIDRVNHYIKSISILNHIQDFQPGDTVSVNFKIIEGERERIQSFEGSIISGRKNKKKIPKIGQNFIIRRVSYGIGVERIVPFFSPNIESVNVIRRGKVRRSKLYYLRGLTGKKARIKEKI